MHPNNQPNYYFKMQNRILSLQQENKRSKTLKRLKSWHKFRGKDLLRASAAQRSSSPDNTPLPQKDGSLTQNCKNTNTNQINETTNTQETNKQAGFKSVTH